MEYATVLLKTSDVLFKFLGSDVCKEIQSIWKYEEDVEIFARTVGLVKDVLSDVEGKHIQHQSVINGYKRLREAFLDAEDFLDKVATHKKKLEADDRKLKGVRRFISGENQPKYAIKVHNEIKKNRKSLNAIAEDLQKFGLGSSGITKPTTKRPREACSFVDTTAIIGRDGDKGRVIDLLLGSPADQKRIPIVSIVGIGGMGKTTLAQLVFNDKTRIESGRFDLNLWVSDSEKSDMTSLMKKILLCTSPDDTSLHNLGQEQLQNRLIREISGKKYLLVLDDLQNESRKEWVDFESLLNRGEKESRILVTTRSRKVARVTGSASTYELKGLSNDDAWKLFVKMAFDGTVDESLVEIGKLIVKKCSEVPLAIKTMGCLLFDKKDKHAWERFRDIEFAQTKEEDNDLMPILKISYDDLDPTLKQCFRYCALLPKNTVISKEILCNIWMANGCIDMSTPERIEDACDDYLETLYNRCFLEKMSTYRRGIVAYFKMHPLMHDLAKEVSGAEMLVLDSGILVDSANKLILQQHVRHVYVKFTVEMVDQISTFDPENTRLRTLLHHDVYTWRNPWEKLINVEKLISKYKVLRMLDLHKWRIENLPNSIGKLIHLRFLDLSHNEFESLPNSIAELWNLQSLLLKNCTNLKRIPNDIVKLVNLRHLNLKGCWILTHMPSGMGALTSLRTLCKFIIGPPESKHAARLEDLEPLSQVQGDLTIELHDKSTPKGSGGGALLVGKRLRKLKIKWPDSRSGDEFENDVDILAKLQPHPDLEELTLYGYTGLTFPPWVMGVDQCSVLPNLVEVVIDNCTRCSSLPSFSKLLRLRRLTICNILGLEYIEADVPTSESFFPSLEYLWVMELPKLKGWCRQLGTDECRECEPSLLLPPFPHLYDLHIYGCPRLRMTCMPLSPIQEFSVKVEYTEFISVSENGGFLDGNCMFHTIDTRLMLSIPWDHYFKGYPSGKTASMMIRDDIGIDILSSNGADAFRRMSKGLVHLILCNIRRMTTLLDGMAHLSALRDLRIESCDEFTEFTRVDEEESEKRLETGECSFGCQEGGSRPWEWIARLERLSLFDLPKLVRLPERFQLNTSLKTLEIKRCCSLKMDFFREGRMPWKGLERLSFGGLSQIVKLPDWIQFATSLKSLTVYKCPTTLTSQKGDIWTKGLNSLESLCLSKLQNMVRLPEWILSVTSLKSLEIAKCDSLEISSSPRKGELSWKGLNNLESLTLSNLPKMTALPEQIQLVTSLKCLTIASCSALEVVVQQGDQMPVKGGFTSLKHLTLDVLPQMARLPEGIHQFATPLQRITIRRCGNLQLPEWVHNTFDQTTGMYNVIHFTR